MRAVSFAGKKAEILTNAMLLNEKMCEDLIDAGLETLWISLNAPHTESADYSFSTIIHNINYFNSIRKSKCNLGLTFVIQDADNTEKTKALREELCADKLNISGEGKEILDNIFFYPTAKHFYRSSICGRACDRACYIHLEEK